MRPRYQAALYGGPVRTLVRVDIVLAARNIAPAKYVSAYLFVGRRPALNWSMRALYSGCISLTQSVANGKSYSKPNAYWTYCSTSWLWTWNAGRICDRSFRLLWQIAS